MSEEKEKYIELVRQLIPVNDLPQAVQNEVMNKASLLKIRKKGEIFKQGDRDGFSYYVLEGEIELHANDQLHNTIVGGTDKAQYAMGQLQPRQFTARAKTNAVVFRIERDSLDKLMVLHEKEEEIEDATVYNLEVDKVEIDDVDTEEDVDWMTRMFQSEIFATMPTANIHQLFALLEPVEYKAGDIVIKQGEAGEHYYIIQEGKCEVLRQPPSGGKDLRLATLTVGDSFGEEALISETTRNATVRMMNDGLVAQLSKDDFVNLIKKPTLTAVSLDTAKETINAGGKWLDVRFKKEHEKPGGIEGSINIPMNMLRMQAEKLDNGVPYVLFCDTGGRSSTGSFLLTAQGFNVSYLEGGLVNHPELAPPEEVTLVPGVPASEATTQPAASVPAEKPAPEVTPEPDDDEDDDDTTTLDAISKQDIDPEIKSSMLDAELARNQQEMQEAKEKQSDADKKQIQEEVEKKLKEERAKIEAAKKQAEQAAQQLRQKEEAKLKELKQKAAQRLQQEKKKLEAVYSRNAEEMEKLEAMKKQAAEKLRLEKERLEKQAQEAKDDLANAEKLKAELAAARAEMEQEAQKRQKEQEEMERQIQLKAKEKLDEERKKLAAEFAAQNAELEKARQEKAAAEASRLAAKEESDKVIAEIKSQHDVEREQAEAKLKAERKLLEEEQKKIQVALEEVRKAKQEADDLRKAALAEVAALKAKQADEEITQSQAAQEALMKDIKAAEARVNQASLNVAKAQQQQFKTEVAKKDNEKEVAKNTAEQEALQAKLKADLEDFKEELEEEEKRYANMKTQLEHMRRIKEKAEAAKKAAKEADAGLLDDIAGQLSDN